MPKGPAPSWKARKEPVLDAYLQASIDGVGGKYDAATGWYKTLHVGGISSRDDAQEVIRSLYRSGRYMKVSVTAKTVANKDGSFTVQFAAINKSHAQSYVASHYGDRPPYNPHARIPREQ